MIEALIYYVVVEAYYFYLKLALVTAIGLVTVVVYAAWRNYRTG